MPDPSSVVGNSTDWQPFECARWRSELVREVSGLAQEPYLPTDGGAELVPPSFLSAQYVDAFALGIPDAPARLNGGNQCRWLADVRVGDLLERKSTVVDADVKTGRTGRLEIYTIETVYRRAGSGEPVARLGYTAIRRYPSEANPSDTAARPSDTAPRPSVTAAPSPSGADRPREEAQVPAGATKLFVTSVAPRDVVRYAVATDDLYEAHYDQPFARASGLPGTIVHGLLKMAWLARGALEYGGAGSVVREISATYRGMDLVGESFTVWALPDNAPDSADTTRLRLYGQSHSGAISTTGTAVIEHRK
ncbi:MAG: MaoC family dehydratase N-terminal domain-containing protein [Micromonosporaceae bacterium]|nr:MaoC family dehydratase N-terminal domain-containing protein [Micromonosporaceae bacterium]